MRKRVYATLIPLYETTCFIQLAVLPLRKIEFRTLANQQAKCFAVYECFLIRAWKIGKFSYNLWIPIHRKCNDALTTSFPANSHVDKYVSRQVRLFEWAEILGIKAEIISFSLIFNI